MSPTYLAVVFLASLATGCGGRQDESTDFPSTADLNDLIPSDYQPLRSPRADLALGTWFKAGTQQIAGNVFTTCGIDPGAFTVKARGYQEMYQGAESFMDVRFEGGGSYFGIGVGAGAGVEKVKTARVRLDDVEVRTLDLNRLEMEVNSRDCKKHLPDQLEVVSEVFSASPAVDFLDSEGRYVDVHGRGFGAAVKASVAVKNTHTGGLSSAVPLSLGFQTGGVDFFSRVNLDAEKGVVWVEGKAFPMKEVEVWTTRNTKKLGVMWNGRAIHMYSMWISVPEGLQPYIESVRYELWHGTNPHDPAVSSDSKSRFRVSRRQWGCMQSGKLHISFKKGSEGEQPVVWTQGFTQCENPSASRNQRG